MSCVIQGKRVSTLSWILISALVLGMLPLSLIMPSQAFALPDAEQALFNYPSLYEGWTPGDPLTMALQDLMMSTPPSVIHSFFDEDMGYPQAFTRDTSKMFNGVATPDHVVFDGTAVRFLGYGSVPYMDMVYYDDVLGGFDSISFTLHPIVMNFHSFSESGLLFNGTFTGEYYTGYALILKCANPRGMMVGGTADLSLFYLENEHMGPDYFAPGNPATTRTLIGTYKTGIETLSTQSFDVRIDKAPDGSFTVMLDGSAVVSVSNPLASGDGFGFYTGYYAHSCSILTVMEFDQVLVTRGGASAPVPTSATVRFVDIFTGADIANPQTVAYPISEIGAPLNPIAQSYVGDLFRVIAPPVIDGYRYVEASRTSLDPIRYRRNPADNEIILYYGAGLGLEKNSVVEGVEGPGTATEPIPVSLGGTFDYELDVINPGGPRNAPAGFLRPGETITSIEAGTWDNRVLTSSGNLYSWGFNLGGNLAIGPPLVTGDVLAPRRVDTISTGGSVLAPGETITSISSTSLFTVALTSLGNIYVWGGNASYQLGLGDTATRTVPTLLARVSAGSLIFAPGEVVTQIAVGGTSTMVLTSAGNVFGWGSNTNGALGNGATAGTTNIPAKNATLSAGSSVLALGEVVTQLWRGSSSGFALTSAGNLFVWGYNLYGGLGLGSTANTGTPTKHLGLSAGGTLLAPGETVVDVAIGGSHTLVLTSAGNLYIMGDNQYGQLGLGNSGAGTNRTTPVKLTDLSAGGALLAPGETIVGLVAGSNTSGVLTSAGNVFMWGYNSVGQLGLGDTVNRTVPAKVESISAGGSSLKVGETVTALSTNYDHVLALTSAQRLFSWGSNGYGQLGVGDKTARDVPTIVEGFGMPDPFVLTDLIPEGLSLVLSGTDPVYTITDGLGNTYSATDLGGLTVEHTVEGTQDRITFTFYRIPAGTLRFTFSVTVEAESLFVNDASLYDSYLQETLVSNETFHSTALVVTEKYQAWGTGDTLAPDTRRGFGPGFPDAVGDPYSPWPFRLRPIIDSAGQTWRLVGYQRLGVDAAPVLGWPPSGMTYDVETGTWEGPGWCWDSITASQTIILFYAKDQQVTIQFRDAANKAGADIKAPVTAQVPGMTDYNLPVAYLAPFATWNYAGEYSLDGGVTVLTGNPPLPTYPADQMTSDKDVVLYFTLNPVVTVQYREFRNDVTGRQNSQLLFDTFGDNIETFTFEGSAPYSIDLMAQPHVAQTATAGAFSFGGQLFPIYRGWSDDGGVTVYNTAPPNLTGITATSRIVLYFTTQYQVTEMFQANDRTHGSPATTLLPDVITDVWGGEPFTGSAPRPVLYAGGFVWHYIGWVMDRTPPDFTGVDPADYVTLVDGVVPPTIAEVNASGITIIYLYYRGDPTAQVTIVERFRELGNTAHVLAPDRSNTVEQGSAFTGNPLNLLAEGWHYYGYQIDGGPVIATTLPLGVIIALVEEGHTVTYLYTKDDGSIKPPKPKPPGPDVPEIGPTGDTVPLLQPLIFLGLLGFILTVFGRYNRRRRSCG